MSKIYAYFRVSTQIKNKKEKKCNEKQREQDYERQKWLITQSGLKIEKVFEERITGGVRGDERIEFKKMLSVLKPGDTVVFTESSRFGRNYIDCFDIVDIITLEYEVNIKFLSNGMTLLGGKKLNPYEWMSLSQFFLADEFQKRLIGFNTSNKLQALKAQGVQLGRKKTITQSQIDEIKRLNSIGWSQNKISQHLKISRTVVSRELK